jgi:hypothetical protein
MSESLIYRKNGIEITIKDDKRTLHESDDTEVQLIEQLKRERARKAKQQANAQIVTFRQAEEERLLKAIEGEKRVKAEADLRIETLHTRIEAVRRGDLDTDLTASIVRQASQIQITNVSVSRATPKTDGEKRERTIITRPPLVGLIKSKSMFRFTNKGKVYTCSTENGGTFTDTDGSSHKSLASWTVAVIERGGGGGRKVSAYEVCEVYLTATNEWKKWGLVYNEETKRIN